MSIADWENPSVTGRNKLPPHADRIHPEKLDLNGKWAFGSFPAAEYLDRFTDLDLPDQLDVPSHPVLSGYGIPIYTNFQYPFPPDPPRVPHDGNPVSVYRRDFELGLLSDGVDVLEMIDEARQRLEDSEYGICLDCGEPIPRKRLEAKPYAKYCTKCKSKREEMDETFYHRR